MNERIKRLTIVETPFSIKGSELTYLYEARTEIEDLEARLAEVEKELKEKACPHVVTTGVSSYCNLAEDSVKRLEAENAKLGNELFKVREELAIQWLKEADGIIEKLAEGEKTWGCGHTNHGSCSQCLGHVTNERNALRSELYKAKVFISSIREYAYCHVEIDRAIKAYDET